MGVYERRFHQKGERFFLLLRQFGTKIWNHAVIAGQDTVVPLDALHFSAAHVSDSHTLCRVRWALVLRVNYRAIQPDAYGRAGPIELAVVRLCGHDVFHGVARNRVRNEGPDKQPGDGGVSIREMKNVRFFLFPFVDLQAGETGISERAIVITSIETGQRGDRINADAEQIVGKRLEKWQRFRD